MAVPLVCTVPDEKPSVGVYYVRALALRFIGRIANKEGAGVHFIALAPQTEIKDKNSTTCKMIQKWTENNI